MLMQLQHNLGLHIESNDMPADTSTQIINRLAITDSIGMSVAPTVELSLGDQYCHAKIENA